MKSARYIGAAATLGVLAALVVSIGETDHESGPAASARPVTVESNRASPRLTGAPPARVEEIAFTDVSAELERIETLDSPEERVAARRALLFSWTSRDLVAVTRWVGTLGPAHSLQQEGNAQIVEALLQCNPDEVVSALRESLPETTSRQLYGPYFRGWAASDPDAAANMLVRLSETAPRDTPQWNDLLGQVSAQWMAGAPVAALDWIKALPEGGGKSSALLQASYRWTELDPSAAAAYAAHREDPHLVKTVAAKWAEAAPADALSWARTLPEGTLRTEAANAARAIWAQTDPTRRPAMGGGL